MVCDTEEGRLGQKSRFYAREANLTRRVYFASREGQGADTGLVTAAATAVPALLRVVDTSNNSVSLSHLDGLLEQPAGFVEPDLAPGPPQQVFQLGHVLYHTSTYICMRRKPENVR